MDSPTANGIHNSRPKSSELSVSNELLYSALGTAVTTQHGESKTTRNHRIVVRWWIFASLSFLILTPIVSILLGLNLHARDFQYLDKSTYDGRTVLFDVALIAADPMKTTMTMDWTIMGESHSDCSSTNLTACSDINIFFDNNLLSSQNSQNPALLRTSDRPPNPIFRFNATVFALKDIVGNTPAFRTQLALFSPGNRQSSLLYYPFDRYSAEIFIFAQDAKTNLTVGVSLAKTRGIAVGFKTDAVTRPDVYIPPGVVDVVITLSRGNLVKAYSIVATIAIWMITIILLLVMITAVFFGFRQRAEILVIPVATLFAFTQVRTSMPGAPAGFGDIVDFVGLLPCLALLALSAAITLGAFILTDPTVHPQQLSWDLWYQAFPKLRKAQTA